MDPSIICRTITGEAVAAPFRQSIVEVTSVAHPRPKLVGILATSSAPSRSYASWTSKACKAVGIDYELREIGSAVTKEGEEESTGSEGDVEQAILEANADPSVNGIMVYVSLI